MKIVFYRVETLWEKKEKILVTKIFSVSTTFSKGLFLSVIEYWNCVVKRDLNVSVVRTFDPF